MYLSIDPERSADLADEDAYRWERARPVCAECGKHIQDEVAYNINGDIYCSECIREARFYIEDWRE